MLNGTEPTASTHEVTPARDGLPNALVQPPPSGNSPADRRGFLIVPEGQARDTARTYTVRKGDTLSSIARRYFGADWREGVKRIYDANRTVLSRPDDLTPGTKLRIPSP